MASHIEFLTNYQPEEQNVRAAVTVLPAVNLCLQRSGAAPIQSVSISNDADVPLEDLDIEIRTSGIYPALHPAHRLHPRR